MTIYLQDKEWNVRTQSRRDYTWVEKKNKRSSAKQWEWFEVRN